MDTLYIQLTNQKAAGLLYQLQELKLIRILNEAPVPRAVNLSYKYKGIISKQQGKELNEHIQKMRSEWGIVS